MVSINLKRITTLIVSIVLIFSLLNINVFAQSSGLQNSQNNQSVFKKEKGQILELGVLDTSTGEILSSKILLKTPDIWDDSVLESLDEKYILVKNELRPLNPGEELPLIAVGEDGMIRPFVVDTIFDIGNFALSLAEFAVSPNFWTGFNVVADGLAVVFPGVPSVTGVKRMINASSTLKDSLKVGINSYGRLLNKTIPTGWERHHIFEKRFVTRLGSGVNTNNMLSIALPKTTHHNVITNKMKSKISHGTDYSTLTKDEILDAHIEAYKELWEDTGDEVYEFLYEFSKTKQIKPNDL